MLTPKLQHRRYGSRIRRFVKHTTPALYTKYGFSLLFGKASKLEIALHYLVRPPTIIGSLPVATMASADFSIHNPYGSRAPQVRTYSFTQYPLNLPVKYLMVSHPLDVSMMCYLIRPYQPLIQFLFVGTGVCSLASFSAYLTVSHLATC